MPTYFPKGRTKRNFPEKMTFRGAGVEGLLEIIDVFVPDDIDREVVASSHGKIIFDFITNEDFNETRTPLYEYFPDHHVNHKFPAKITLRGPEVDALKEMCEMLKDDQLSPEAQFLKDFVENQMKNEKLHVRMPSTNGDAGSDDGDVDEDEE